MGLFSSGEEVSTSVFIYTILALSGQVISWLIASYQKLRYKSEQLAKFEKITSELSIAKQQIASNEHWRRECELLNNELRSLRNINTSLEVNLREVTTRLESTKLHAEDKIRQIVSNEERLNKQFENLANRVFEKSSHQLDEKNRQSLNNLLCPLREQLSEFYQQTQKNFNQDVLDRHILVHEIRDLQQLNTQMTQETINLTRALKGSNKTQGNWGEVILTRILESSGLREGHEYETQVTVETTETDVRSRVRPDVVIRLPQGKNVVIDAKMTLVAYERYFNAGDECVRESALQEHIVSIRKHIRHLGQKDYQKLFGSTTLDYVIMFIPIEPAFLLALDRQPELITEALRSNIMLVSPTTLLVALRTIANLWHHEYQSRNVQQIADRASKLYDKMRLFVDDLSSIGKSLDRAQDNYHQAIKKLVSGRGNLLAQVESLRTLGVEIKQEINPELVEQAILQDEDAHNIRYKNVHNV